MADFKKKLTVLVEYSHSDDVNDYYTCCQTLLYTGYNMCWTRKVPKGDNIKKSLQECLSITNRGYKPEQIEVIVV